MAAVVFTVDAETHHWAGPPSATRRSPEWRCRELRCPDPVRDQSTRTRQDAVDEVRRLDRATTASAASSSTRTSRRSSRTTEAFYPIYEAIAGGRACRRSSTPATRGSAPASRAAAESGSSTRTRCTSTTSPSTSRSLKIVLAHPSFPWQDEAISVALHKRAGLHRPLRLVAEVLPAAARPLREHPAARSRALRLGLSDDHARPLARRISSEADFKDEVRPLILKDNAVELLGLRGPDAG